MNRLIMLCFQPQLIKLLMRVGLLKLSMFIDILSCIFLSLIYNYVCFFLSLSLR